MRYHPMPRAFCWRPANWLAKDSTIPRSTPWCWQCRFPGRGRCSNTRADCTASTPPRPTCALSISWTQATRHCCGCGKNASVDTARWAIGWRMKEVPIDAEPAPFLAIPRHCLQSWESTKRLASHQPTEFTLASNSYKTIATGRWLSFRHFQGAKSPLVAPASAAANRPTPSAEFCALLTAKENPSTLSAKRGAPLACG